MSYVSYNPALNAIVYDEKHVSDKIHIR